MNKKLYRKYQSNIIFDFYNSNLSGSGYVVNVKLHNAFDYDEDTIIKKFDYIKDEELKVKLAEKIKSLSEESIDEIFWWNIEMTQNDAVELAQFGTSEIDKITAKPIFVGRSGGYFGFDINPLEILSEYENDEYDDEDFKEMIEELEQINKVLEIVEKESKSIKLSDIMEDYIENNILEDVEEELSDERRLADIIKNNIDEISVFKKNMEEKNIRTTLELIN